MTDARGGRPTLAEALDRAMKRYFDAGDVVGLTPEQKMDTVRVRVQEFARSELGKQNVSVEIVNHRAKRNGDIPDPSDPGPIGYEGDQ